MFFSILDRGKFNVDGLVLYFTIVVRQNIKETRFKENIFTVGILIKTYVSYEFRRTLI